jgi:hypothetical protein
MIRLTVLYNLAAGSDEEAYVAWRLSAHADYIRQMPGVVGASFGRVLTQWSSHAPLDYAFQSTVEWPDRESFEQAFHNDKAQADLRENLRKIGDYKFIVSEIIAGE